jgi:hypothetical protein
MQPLYEVADFVRAVRRRFRFGELSRAPIRILRLELQGDSAGCDWVTRPPDVWDAVGFQFQFDNGCLKPMRSDDPVCHVTDAIAGRGKTMSRRIAHGGE